MRLDLRLLEKRDADVIWHPYTQHGLSARTLSVRSAQGAYLTLEDGSKLLDAISSWWVNLHGHSHPKIVEAIRAQAVSLDHVLFAGFTHEPAVRLAELLVGALRVRGMGHGSKIFYSDNGSTAVEAALKIAYQFHVNRGSPRKRFLALRGSYHGDTLGSMSVGEPVGFHSVFQKLFFDVDFVEPNDLEGLQRKLVDHRKDYAAFIFEPLIQGAGGMRVYSRQFLTQALALCKEAKVVTIADEVFTGFYRTGTLFAFEQTGEAPDILCLSKGITGGFLPLAATACREQIFQEFKGPDLRSAFLHGHSYTANPIACAAALASWELLSLESCQRNIAGIVEQTQEYIDRLSRCPGIVSARSLGTIGAVELEDDKTGGYFSQRATRLLHESLRRGVLLRPLGNVLYAVPPYCVTWAEVKRIYETMEEVVRL